MRVGIFLTPFGIWNVDHGSPARTMVQPPLMYSSHFGGFPERQLGIELYGRARTGAVSWDYHLTVSNGGGPTQLYFDLDDNKAIGARLKVSQAGRVRWHFGISGLWSTTTDNEQHLELPDFDVTDEITVRHDDLVLGADASLKVDGFAVATEVVASWREYADGERPPTYVNPTVLEPDRWAVGVYAQLSYDLPIQGVRLRPYVMGSFIDWDDNRERDDTIGIAGGLRWGFTPTVALKIEYQHWRWVNEADDPVIFDGTPPWHIYTTELSVAF